MKFDLKINVGHSAQCKSQCPIFHGPMILPYNLKFILCINIKLEDYDSI